MKQFVKEEMNLLDQNIAELFKQFEIVRLHREWLENYVLRNGMKEAVSQIRLKTAQVSETIKF